MNEVNEREPCMDGEIRVCPPRIFRGMIELLAWCDRCSDVEELHGIRVTILEWLDKHGMRR